MTTATLFPLPRLRTAPPAPPTTRQAAVIRELLDLRRTALADLGPALHGARPDGRWTLDRIGDVEYANRAIERYAEMWGWEPGELIGACEGEG